MTELEAATLELGERLRELEFGTRLREWHPSRRASNAPFGSLATYEVNSAPAIRRTFQTLSITQMAGQDLALDDEDKAYVEWITRAWRATQRIAGKCWWPIPERVRTLLVDEDDLGPHVSHYIPAAREHEIGPALRFAGLDTPDVLSLLDKVVAACRATPCHAHARELSDAALSGGVIPRLADHRKRVIASFDSSERLTIGQAGQRRRDLIRMAYVEADEDIRQLAAALKAHNELVNYILFALLGLAETSQTTVVDSDTGPVRCRRKRRLLWIHFGTFDARPMFIGHPPAPFILRAGLPIDGLYMLEGSTTSWSGRSLVDVHARRFRELEEQPE